MILASLSLLAMPLKYLIATLYCQNMDILKLSSTVIKFAGTKKNGNAVFISISASLKRARDGTRTLFCPEKIIKSRRNVHCLQGVYNLL